MPRTWKDRILSVHFWLSEFACPCGCGSKPPVDPELVAVLERIRAAISKPIVVHGKAGGGHRCPNLVRKMEGEGKTKSTTQHGCGRAADIHVTGVKPEVLAAIAPAAICLHLAACSRTRISVGAGAFSVPMATAQVPAPEAAAETQSPAWEYDSWAIGQDIARARLSVTRPGGYHVEAEVGTEVRPEGQSATSETARTALRIGGWLGALYFGATGQIPKAPASVVLGEGGRWRIGHANAGGTSRQSQ